ncbi:hypothetical protein [Lutibacter citreus]|uniref:hypothetical protein n=1 Tax=Lutibacter citreus TaxID=2138210 RepID=UPI000DBE0A33|nr:hypothetical protein [Lutibacter citreus]
MKTKILSLAVIVFMAGIVLISCGQTSKKDAKSVKEDVKELNKDVKQGAIDSSKEIKTTVISNWKKFETTSKIAIENTDKQINILKMKISKANKNEKVKLVEQLNKLEQKNKEIKEKLTKRSKEFKDGVISFNETAKANEQQFEREFNHDMDELGLALKDLLKNNVN